MTQGISRKLFQILLFWGVTQGIFRKLFPGKSHEYLPMEKYFSQKRVMTQSLSGNFFQCLEIVSGKSPESRPKIAKSGKIWKKFPGYPLSHRPFFGNSFRDLPIWIKKFRLLSNDCNLISNFLKSHQKFGN